MFGRVDKVNDTNQLGKSGKMLCGHHGGMVASMAMLIITKFTTFVLCTTILFSRTYDTKKKLLALFSWTATWWRNGGKQGNNVSVTVQLQNLG
jgi:hypothetical protein